VYCEGVLVFLVLLDACEGKVNLCCVVETVTFIWFSESILVFCSMTVLCSKFLA